LLLAACGTPRSYRADPGPYDRVPPEWHAPLGAARLAFERGEAHEAFLLVARLCNERPRIVPVRLFLQEIQLHLLEREGRVGDLLAGVGEARAVLAASYERLAESEPRAEGYVLAARLCADGEQALALLDEADAIDARCVWVHYARAWWRYRLRRFKEARESLRVALRLDGGHLPSLRLNATMLAGAGDSEQAAATLEVWLERSSDDPLYAAAERAEALLDLAALQVLLDEPGEALNLLEELDPRAVRDPVRAEVVRAAAHELRGERARALEAVNRAHALDPGALLPLVQRALVLEGAGDPEGERDAWLRLLELTERTEPKPEAADLASIDFEGALFRLQARTRLERLAAAPRAP
jgi:tetratricopeptide (TPR) repeat protein